MVSVVYQFHMNLGGVYMETVISGLEGVEVVCVGARVGINSYIHLKTMI
jgi:hypothetical protein